MDISVVIPVHDEGLLLKATLQSVFNQQWGQGTAPDIEIIVVVDRPTPTTRSEVEGLARGSHDNIKVITNDRLPGSAGSRNTGILAAKGEWVAFLDGDDIWTEDSLAARWAALKNQPDAGWVGADFVYWHETEPINHVGTLQEQPGTAVLLEAAFRTGEPTIYRRPAAQFLTQILCCTDTVMAKRQLLVSVGLFDEALFRAQDVHLWYRLAGAADYVFVPRVLAHYRQRSSTLARRGTTLYEHHGLALKKLMSDPAHVRWRKNIRTKLSWLYDAESAYLRSERRFHRAARAAILSIGYNWRQTRAYRNFLASMIFRA